MKSVGRKSGFLKYIITFIAIAAVGFAAVYFLILNDNTYTVQYNAMGGVCNVIEIEVEKDGTLTLPIPSKDGYEFGGWYNGDKKWESTDKVTDDLRLIAKWIPIKYNITFIVDGHEIVESCNYGEMPSMVNVVKEPTAQIEYKLTGFIPELVIVVGEATYTAVFTEVERKYDLSVTSNIDEAGTFSGIGEYSYNSVASLSVEVSNGYTFLGWYTADDQLYSQVTRLSLVITQDVLLNAKFEITKYFINYYNTKNCQNNNLNEYTINTPEINLSNLIANGYTFLGWFTKATGGVKITAINTASCMNLDLYAHWDIINYNISYIMNGGTNNASNPTTYNIEDTITIIQPVRIACTFKGWKVNGSQTFITDYVINAGTYGDLVLEAMWDGDVSSITLMVDDIELVYDVINVPNGTKAEEPVINSLKYDMLGYSVDGWYTSSELTTKFNFAQNIYNDVTIYGTWEYIIEQGFYPYYDKFINASTMEQMSIDSYKELVAYAEYVEFFDITAKNLIKLTYTTLSGDELFEELNNAILDSTCNASSIMGYSRYSSPSVASVYVLTSFRDVEATLTADPNKNYINKQQAYAYSINVTPTRDANFENFPINKVKDTLTVSTTDQLVYALEKGLRPICVENSKAEKVYKIVKNVLRYIINDSMDTITKVRAIYEWLILNVSYDNLAADDNNIAASWKNYDAWYLEGVFLKQKAVCDGLAKAFVVLAQMENIPAIRVDGNQHAWNKVYIDGKWYGIDTTHGDLQVGDSSTGKEYEILTNTSFLFTDSYKALRGYSTTDYQDIVATAEFNYYDYATHENNGREFDLKIDSMEEFYDLLNYTKNFAHTSTYYTIEFVLNFYINFQTLVRSGEMVTGLDVVLTLSGMTDSLGQQVYVLFI